MNFESIQLNTQHQACEIIIGKWQDHLHRFISDKDIVFLTDQNVFKHYKDFLNLQRTIVIKPGESSKTIDSIARVYRQLIDLEADRSTLIIGFGGGVVTDIAGFIASTFMRGIQFGFISTSLLGQVDAVIGGKNGINLDGYKNMVGTFNQPSFIINDPGFFKTLPKQEFINGLAEVIKQFLVADKQGLDWFIKNLKMILAQDEKLLNELIIRQNKIKVNVVLQDEKEQGIRKILNFGHSFGHAIEKELHWPHGHAIAAGMGIALKISALEGYLDNQVVDGLLGLIADCGLPNETGKNDNEFIESMKKDKKKNKDSIDFILLDRPGKALIKPFTFDALVNKINKISA